jgi:predicted glutamine amidotransferase
MLIAGAIILALAEAQPHLAYGTESTRGAIAEEHNCRFWAAVSDAVPGFVINDHLIHLPNSIEQLSKNNPSGWSVAYFCVGDTSPTVHRGGPPAYLDPLFDTAVVDAANASPQIALSHIRACSSGLCDIPNPHPFERVKNGRHWLMGHNGTISKQILLDLIRPEYFEANPPQYGANYSEWIDSDLYFVYMLQTLEDFGWQIKYGIGEVVKRLREEIPGDAQLNFFLTDGMTLWAYREGHSLYYMYDPARIVRRHGTPRSDAIGAPYSAVASQPPSSSQGNWIEMTDGELVILAPCDPPQVEDVEAYFDAPPVRRPDSAVGSRGDSPCGPDLRVVTGCRGRTGSAATIRYRLAESRPVTLRVYDVSGRLVQTLLSQEMVGRGQHSTDWDGTDDSGRRASSGVYFFRLDAGPVAETARIAVVR